MDHSRWTSSVARSKRCNGTVTVEWSDRRLSRVKLSIAVSFLIFGASLASAAESEPSPKSSATKFDATAKQVAEMEKQLSLAIAKRNTAFLEKVFAETYFDVWEGEKRAMSRANTIARCQAGQLKFLVIERDQEMHPEGPLVAVEGFAKSVANRRDDTMPEEQWIHVRRLWTNKDGNWLLTCQIRRLEGDNGEGEVD